MNPLLDCQFLSSSNMSADDQQVLLDYRFPVFSDAPDMTQSAIAEVHLSVDNVNELMLVLTQALLIQKYTGKQRSIFGYKTVDFNQNARSSILSVSVDGGGVSEVLANIHSLLEKNSLPEELVVNREGIPPLGVIVNGISAADFLNDYGHQPFAYMVLNSSRSDCLLKCIYNPRYTTSDQAEKLLVHLIRILGKVNDGCCIENILSMSLPSDSEIDFLNTCGEELKKDFVQKSIGQQVEYYSQNFPNNIAVESGDIQLTYSQLNEQANQLAAYLMDKEVLAGDYLIVLFEPSADILIALLAIHKIGAVYVPLDPSFPSERVEIIIDEVLPKKILCMQPSHTIPGRYSDRLINYRDIINDVACYSAINLFSDVSDESISHLFFTSGTTGKPKGVMSTRANLNHYLQTAQDSYRFCADDKFIAVARFTFSISFFELLLPLMVGACVRIIPRADILSLESLSEHIRWATVFHIGPGLLKKILPYIEEYYTDTSSFYHLRHVSSGGDMVAPELLEKLKRIFSNAEVYVIYGSSEISCMGCRYFVPRDQFVAKTLVGRPHSNVSVKVVDAYDNPVPQGVTGDILFGGDGLAKGYLHLDELTAEKFIWLDGQRFYRIGDVGRFDRDGNLEMLGRKDYQVQVNGVRIELGEIDYYLRQSPGVSDAVASTVLIDDDRVLVGYVVLPEDSDLTARKIRQFLSNKLPDYMIPALYVRLLQLPLNHNMKLDRNALPEPEDDNLLSAHVDVPEDASVSRVKGSVTLLQTVQEIAQKVLSLQSINAQANFFELGGDSLKLMEFRYRLQKETGVLLTIALLGDPDSSLAVIADALFQCQSDSEDSSESLDCQSDIDGLPDSISGRLFFADNPPESDLRLGKDLQGHPGWYAVDTEGRYWLWQHSRAESSASDSVVDYDPFADYRLEKAFPLSTSQMEIWLSSIASDDANCAYNLTFTFEITGNADEFLMRSALEQLVSRHESLRSYIALNDSLMCIRESIDLPFFVVKQKNFSLKKFTDSESMTAFDISQAPLFRCHYIDKGNEMAIVVLTFHHLVCDGWSVRVIMDELGEIYRGMNDNIPVDLINPFPYSQFCLLEHVRRYQPGYDKTLRYWVNLFSGSVPPVFDMPYPKSRPSIRSYAAARCDLPLSTKLWKKVNSLAIAQGVSPFVVMYSAYLVLLSRLSGQNDIVVGVPSAYQVNNNISSLVGHCVNALPIRNRIENYTVFSDLLATVSHNLCVAQEHANFTFGDLLTQIKLERDPARIPIMATLFNLQSGDHFLNLGEKSIAYHQSPRQFETFELSINVVANTHQFDVHCQYNTQLITPECVERWLSIYHLILTEVCEAPEILVSEISVLCDNDRQKLQQWNSNSRAEYPSNNSLIDLINQQMLDSPSSVAAMFSDQTLTYEELDRRSACLARLLVDRGAGPDVLIGLCVERSVEMMVALLAILRAGSAYLPLDPEYPISRIDYILNNANAPLLITQRSLSTLIPKDTSVFFLDDDWYSESIYPLHRHSELTPDHLAYVIYTSGSTGNPKGVQVTHRNVVNFLWSMKHKPGLRPTDRILAVTTLSFDIAVLELYLPLITGASVDIAPRAMAVDGQQLTRRLTENNITVMQATPATWRMLVESGWDGLPTLKALVGGEALPKDLLPALLKMVGELWNMYGPTETTVWSTCCPVISSDEVVTIGKPIANTQTYVLDSQGHRVPIGVPGELYIGGEGVTRGYLGMDELTRERFVVKSFDHQSSTLYRTGDQVVMTDSGDIRYLNRLDNQVKVRGYRIELGEVEAALTRHPEVKQAVVDVREDTPGDKRLIGYVVSKNLQPIDMAFLRDYLQSHLPVYMVPQVFIFLTSIPLTPNGKVDRKQLPSPDVETQYDIDDYTPPETALHELLQRVWSDVLNIPLVSIDADFFELGGHSLLAVRIISRINRESGTDLPITCFIQATTIRKMALYIESEQGALPSGAVKLKQGNKIPLHCLYGILLYRELADYLPDSQAVVAMYLDEEIGILNDANVDYFISAFSDIHTIVDKYYRIVKSVQPSGPYYLCGASFGGVVALEVARKLKLNGDEVALVAMMESWHPRIRSDFSSFLKVAMHLQAFRKRPIAYSADLIKKCYDRLTNKVSFLNDSTIKDSVKRTIFDPRHQARAGAIKNYRSQFYDGKVVIYRARDKGPMEPDNPTLGWKGLISDMEVVNIPGTHMGILKEPNIKMMTDHLKHYLPQ